MNSGWIFKIVIIIQSQAVGRRKIRLGLVERTQTCIDIQLMIQ